jgi:hypothetical protein
LLIRNTGAKWILCLLMLMGPSFSYKCFFDVQVQFTTVCDLRIFRVFHAASLPLLIYFEIQYYRYFSVNLLYCKYCIQRKYQESQASTVKIFLKRKDSIKILYATSLQIIDTVWPFWLPCCLERQVDLWNIFPFGMIGYKIFFCRMLKYRYENNIIVKLCPSTLQSAMFDRT